jgi:hypothetical protein
MAGSVGGTLPSALSFALFRGRRSRDRICNHRRFYALCFSLVWLFIEFRANYCGQQGYARTYFLKPSVPSLAPVDGVLSTSIRHERKLSTSIVAPVNPGLGAANSRLLDSRPPVLPQMLPAHAQLSALLGAPLGGRRIRFNILVVRTAKQDTSDLTIQLRSHFSGLRFTHNMAN